MALDGRGGILPHEKVEDVRHLTLSHSPVLHCASSTMHKFTHD